MELKRVRIKHFRNIIDTRDVDIDDSVTCVVGKNESGKTAFLQSLYRLNPARPAQFSIPENYPAWLEKKHKLQGVDLSKEKPVQADFVLTKEAFDTFEAAFGPDVLSDGGEVTFSRNYKNDVDCTFEYSEVQFVKHIREASDWATGTKTKANGLASVEDMRQYASELQADEDEAKQSTGKSVTQRLNNTVGQKSLSEAIAEWMIERLPKFMYFSEYSSLPYSVDIDRVLTADKSSLKDDELTARSLLLMAAADDDYLRNPDYERRKRELENVANVLTQDVLKYWSQNPSLRVQPDIVQETKPTPQGQTSVLKELKIRIWDDRHQLSLPFNEHSTGFQWFFSFLAAFSEFEFSEDPVIILLDEPALGLHAKAQADFLRFIDERLSPKRQVLYSTHSPFMVRPGKLEQVRLVEDKGLELGSVVTSDVTTTDPDTLFPLQGALGYDLVQNLFVAPHNLVVEGTSDYTFLRLISDYLTDLDREGLDEKWSIVPVGGIDVIPSFVALLGQHLELTVVIDGKRSGSQRLANMTKRKLLKEKRIIAVADILGQQNGDIEDLFDAADYLKLFNPSFGKKVKIADLKGDDAIVNKLARILGVHRYNHGKPADYLLRNANVLFDSVSAVTLERFEKVFVAINKTLI